MPSVTGNDGCPGAELHWIACRFEILLSISSLISEFSCILSPSFQRHGHRRELAAHRGVERLVANGHHDTANQGLIDLDRQIELALEVLFQLRVTSRTCASDIAKAERISPSRVPLQRASWSRETGNLGRTVSRSFWANSFSRVVRPSSALPHAEEKSSTSCSWRTFGLSMTADTSALPQMPTAFRDDQTTAPARLFARQREHRFGVRPGNGDGFSHMRYQTLLEANRGCRHARRR